MKRAQSDSEFVETAFATEDVVEATPAQTAGADALACAFLDRAWPQPERQGSNQDS